MVGEMEDCALFFLDVQGNVGSWNKGAEMIKGYTAAEVIGTSFRRFYTAEGIARGLPDQMIEEARRNGTARQSGWRVKKDGNLFWAQVTLSAMHDEEGKLIGFSKFTRDMTEKMSIEKALNEYARELEFKNKELEQFVYIASHDLQEPLLTVRNFVDLLKDEYGSVFDENAELYLTFINQSTERMRNLIKGLLDYSRLGGNQPKKQIDLNAIIDGVRHDLYTQIESSGARIFCQELPLIRGHETAIRQLFQNLLSNSLKFRKVGVPPEIHISAQQDGEFWKFEVRDNGIGIEERFTEKIFAIFQRLHSHSEYEGHGIGLSHCKKIVEMHSGEIYVKSLIGEGSCFYFTIKI
ncbi:histidine kinase sensor protein [Pedobacter sp. BAL39]|nr:histidine kinase sensor protein [Pedobacter sp. BAL39]